MSQDDPFAEPDDDADKTVIRPSPGRRRPGAPAAPPAAAPRRGAAAAPAGGPRIALVDTGINRLVAAASSLLGLAIRLKNSATHSDVEGLHSRVIGEVKNFEQA
ncbi:MAG: type VI secretion system protein TssL, partial [Inquilinus sp.]|nr:type VI secretion system protein TssL [Inquilinus sp.]